VTHSSYFVNIHGVWIGDGASDSGSALGGCGGTHWNILRLPFRVICRFLLLGDSTPLCLLFSFILKFKLQVRAACRYFETSRDISGVFIY